MLICLLPIWILGAQESRPEKLHRSKHAVYVEVLGKGILGGVFYEYTVSEHILSTRLALGVGMGIMPLVGAHPMIYLSPETPSIIPNLSIYLNIIPQLPWLLPQSSHVRFYLEPGLSLAPLPSSILLGVGVHIQKQSRGLWGRLGVATTRLPNITLGWNF